MVNIRIIDLLLVSKGMMLLLFDISCTFTTKRDQGGRSLEIYDEQERSHLLTK